MTPTLSTYAYLLAAVLFVMALKMMASPRTARRGNLLGALGMLIAIAATVLLREGGNWWITPAGWWVLAIGGTIGVAIGVAMALSVPMTGMPQMVAVFNGFGGLASALVVLANLFVGATAAGAAAVSFGRGVSGYELSQFTVAVGASTLIGWVTFTGSMIAFLKLQELGLSGRPITWPAHKLSNLLAMAAAVALVVLMGYRPEYRWLVIPLAVLAALLGMSFTLPIGGADMPVVISLLNSYSGLAACATGFVLRNPGLIIAGSLVGASGIVLTRIMCMAMNRSLANVLFGAVGGAPVGGGAGDENRRVTAWTPDDAAIALDSASLVVIVPGYGMAVAQAQHAVKELADVLANRGVDVKFGIHEVAGRMPGHMNVLLAEAEVPYERLCDRETINPEMERADAVIVLGANDVVNPAARSDKSSPIYGMPIMDVDKARTCMVIKRSLRPGFAGVENELFYMPNTKMVFGDGKQVVLAIVAALKAGV